MGVAPKNILKYESGSLFFKYNKGEDGRDYSGGLEDSELLGLSVKVASEGGLTNTAGGLSLKLERKEEGEGGDSKGKNVSGLTTGTHGVAVQVVPKTGLTIEPGQGLRLDMVKANGLIYDDDGKLAFDSSKLRLNIEEHTKNVLDYDKNGNLTFKYYGDWGLDSNEKGMWVSSKPDGGIWAEGGVHIKLKKRKIKINDSEEKEVNASGLVTDNEGLAVDPIGCFERMSESVVDMNVFVRPGEDSKIEGTNLKNVMLVEDMEESKHIYVKKMWGEGGMKRGGSSNEYFFVPYYTDKKKTMAVRVLDADAQGPVPPDSKGRNIRGIAFWDYDFPNDLPKEVREFRLVFYFLLDSNVSGFEGKILRVTLNLWR
ncbi:hypothetical protein DIE19_33520 [Burkholderia sp. Bp9126]|nr:hypothetical protein DIE19_33520 [Burkholderia sp. Bp9126]